MFGLRNAVGKWKVVALASAVAAVAFVLAPPDFIATVSGELINFFGFVIAAVLPAMALTATSLRGSGMSIKRLLQLRSALDLQMRFWAGLVIVSFIAVVFVVLMKQIVACAPNVECKPIEVFTYKGWSFDTRLSNAVLGYLFGVIFFQLANVLRGLQGLLAVNSEAAIGEAQQRFDDAMSDTSSQIAKIRNPPGYGDTIQLPENTGSR
ncbi:hypothetical protein [Methylobacterium sp. Leaf111]|uniref:hypothetical protein n=1 Tax=Methylobacterium sp. Leaf111 TaxID=1736257 RepID=UPI000A3EA4BC|nr:hypothetical protein [Methylobacterium sp. Leaf111]